MSEPDPTPEAASGETAEQAEGQPVESAATPADPGPFTTLSVPVPPEPEPEAEEVRPVPPVSPARPTLDFPAAVPAERPEASPVPPDPQVSPVVEPPPNPPPVVMAAGFEMPPPVPAPVFEDPPPAPPPPSALQNPQSSASADEAVEPAPSMGEAPAPDPGPAPSPFAKVPEAPPAAPVSPAPVPSDASSVPPVPPVAEVGPNVPPVDEAPVPPVAEVGPHVPPVDEAPVPPVAEVPTPAQAPFSDARPGREFAALSQPQPEPETAPAVSLPEPVAGGQAIFDVDGMWVARSSNGSKAKLSGRLGRKQRGPEAAAEEAAPAAAAEEAVAEGALPVVEGFVPEGGKSRRGGFTFGRKKAAAPMVLAVPADGTSPTTPPAEAPGAPESNGKRRARFSLGRKKKEPDDFPADPAAWEESPPETAASAVATSTWAEGPQPATPSSGQQVAMLPAVPVPPVPAPTVAESAAPPVFADAVPAAPIPAPPVLASVAPDAVGERAAGDSMWGVGAATPSPDPSGAQPAPTETAKRGPFGLTLPFSRRPKTPGAPKSPMSFPKGPKSLVSVLLVLLLALGGLGYMFLGRSGSGGPSPAFALDLVAGQSYAYRFTFNIQGSAVAGGQTIPLNESLGATMDWNVQSVDPSGVATVGVSMSDFRFTVNGKALPASELPSADTHFTMQVDRNGLVLSSGGAFGDALAGSGASSGGLPGTNQLTPLLPGHDVKPGDTWAKTFHQDLPLGIGTLRFKTQSRYVRDEQMDGVNAAVIETTMNVPLHMKMDLAKLLQAAGSQQSLPPGSHPVIRYRGRSNMVDTGWFDPAKRQMVKMQLTGAINMRMTFEGMPSGSIPNGGSVSFRGAMTMDLERA